MDEDILLLVDRSNKHWRTGRVALAEGTVLTPLYNQVARYLDERQVIALVGLRRTGKTVLMCQLMAGLLERGHDPRRLFYFSFDDLMCEKRPDVLASVIEHYLHGVLGEAPDRLGGRAYLFLDEVQHISHWQTILKRYYDLGYPIKFVVSGSSSLQILKKGKESLAGRLYDFVVRPLDFRCFLRFKGVDLEQVPGLDAEAVRRAHEDLVPRKAEIQALLDEYLVKGGFPENVAQADLDKAQAYIRGSVIEKVVYTDLPVAFGLRSPEVLDRLLKVVGRHSSDLFELRTLAEALGVSAPTVSEYLFYLEKADLLAISYNYTKSRMKQLRTMKKAYTTDSGVLNVLSHNDASVLARPEAVGRIVETVVFNHCARRHPTFFWRDKQRREVDLVLETPEGALPIEVKYQRQVTEGDLSSIRSFMARNGLGRGILVTRDTLEERGDVLLVPAWLFLLMMG